MANPNIAALTQILGQTSQVTPGVTSAVVLLANGSATSNVYKIGMISVANLTATAQTATISLYTNGSVAANLAPSGGNTFPLISGVSVPPNSSIIVMDKTSPLYLTENTSIVVTSSSSISNLCFTTSYEQIF